MVGEKLKNAIADAKMNNATADDKPKIAAANERKKTVIVDGNLGQRSGHLETTRTVQIARILTEVAHRSEAEEVTAATEAIPDLVDDALARDLIPDKNLRADVHHRDRLQDRRAVVSNSASAVETMLAEVKVLDRVTLSGDRGRNS